MAGVSHSARASSGQRESHIIRAGDFDLSGGGYRE